ncbi:MAG: hypothetical protein H6566_29830 [Lewinellaceae bacterium]|nr:hypothetical protein [Lewinellaceae bacterium]
MGLAKRSQSISQLHAFLEKYPDSRFELEANALIAKIKDDNEWNLAQRERTVRAFERYLRQFPQGEHRRQAENLIQEIKVIQPEWERTKRKNTPAAYQNFLEKYRFRSDKYSELAEEELEQLEEQYWKKARSRNTIREYRNYLSSFPSGSYAEEAEGRIIDLEVSAIFQGEHGFLPPMSRTGASSYTGTEMKLRLKMLRGIPLPSFTVVLKAYAWLFLVDKRRALLWQTATIE